MSIFVQHTAETAPAEAGPILEKIKERYGFIPNLAAKFAESPVTLGAVLNLAGTFDETSYTPQEQQVILLTVSLLNGCTYCKTAHTALGRKAEVGDADLKAIINFEPLPTDRLNTLRNFTKLVYEKRGFLEQSEVEAFLADGFTKAQILELILGLAMKTLTNYANHIADTQPNPEFLAMAEPALSKANTINREANGVHCRSSL